MFFAFLYFSSEERIFRKTDSSPFGRLFIFVTEVTQAGLAGLVSVFGQMFVRATPPFTAVIPVKTGISELAAMPGVAIGAEIPAFAGMTDSAMAGVYEVCNFME